MVHDTQTKSENRSLIAIMQYKVINEKKRKRNGIYGRFNDDFQQILESVHFF